MDKITHKINLSFNYSERSSISIKQGSNKTHTLLFSLYDSKGLPLLPQNNWEAINFVCKKQDGTMIYNPIDLTQSNLTIDMTNQMLSSVGTMECELEIVIPNNESEEKKVLYTNNFYIYIEKNVVSGEEIESTNEFKSIEKVVEDLKKLDIVDNLESDDMTKALSAKQGKVLKELIDQGGGTDSRIRIEVFETDVTER